jgi:NADH dehydrogenase (ubiquinone) 1 alpha subcomplex subunit 9
MESSNFSFPLVHVDMARAIAEACTEEGVQKLIHVSALGASSTSSSKFYQSNAAGEAAVKAAFPTATIGAPPPHPSPLRGSGSPHVVRHAAARGPRLTAAHADAVRPAVMYGWEDRLFNRMAQASQIFPFLPLVDGGETQYQPVHGTRCRPRSTRAPTRLSR